MDKNRLFNRTRIQLTAFYAIAIELIILLSGYGIHWAMIRVFERTVDRELNTLAGTVHDTLEGILKQPEIVDSVVMKVLPGLCLVGGECAPKKADAKISELTQKYGYCLRLLSLDGREIATLGGAIHRFPRWVPKQQWETIADDRGERYHIHTVALQTIDERNWGYLQVAQSYRLLDEYMQSLHLLLLVGLPLVMFSVGGASWWLSGLAMQPIYRSYEQMQQFTADAAHELRTPLAVARVAVENALSSAKNAPETQTNLEIIDRQVHHLTRLAADLLWLSRLEAKQLPVFTQSCCLNEIISDLEEEFAPLAIAANIDLRVEMEIDRPVYVIGDLDRLYRAIANLINNAIAYTPDNGIVTINLAYSDRTAILTIRDTGIGISSADLPQIFDRFYRVQVDRARATGGTGLGLAIVRAIVISHQGTVEVSSQLNQGSIFTVRLPLSNK